MTWIMAILVFIGGIGVGVTLLMVFLVTKVKDKKAISKGFLYADEQGRPCAHRFFGLNLFHGKAEICGICGWTILSANLFNLNNRDVKIAARLLEQQGSTITVATLHNDFFASEEEEE